MRRKRFAGVLVAMVLLEVVARYGKNSWLGVVGMGVVLGGLWIFDRRLAKSASTQTPSSPENPGAAIRNSRDTEVAVRQTSFGQSVVTGLVAGVVLLFLACAYLVLGQKANHAGVLSLTAMYVAGGLIGGMVFWVTQPLMARGHPGRGLVGVLSSAPLGLAVGLSLPTTMMEPRGPGIIASLVYTCLLGGGYFMVDR